MQDIKIMILSNTQQKSLTPGAYFSCVVKEFLGDAQSLKLNRRRLSYATQHLSKIHWYTGFYKPSTSPWNVIS